MRQLFIRLKELRKTKKFLIPFMAVSLVCFLAAISGLNKPHLNPFTGSIKTLHPTAVSYSDSGLQLIDNEKNRLLICNSDDELTAVADAGMYGSPADNFIYVTSCGGRIYAIGTTAYNQGLYLSSEKVIEYDRRGNFVRTVYSESYTEDSKQSHGCFSHLAVSNDGIYLTKSCGHNAAVIFIDEEGGSREIFSSELPESVYRAGYDACGNCCFAIGLSKNCYYIPCDTGEIIGENSNDYYSELSAAFNEMQDYIPEIKYSTELQLKTIGFWLAVAVLCIELLALLIWLILRKSIKTDAVMLMAGAVVLVSFFYISRINTASEDAYIRSLETQSGQIGYALSRFYGEIFEEIRNDGIHEYCSDVSNQEELDSLRTMLKEFCDVNDSKNTCYAGCYLYDRDGMLYTFADSCSSIIAGQPVALSSGLVNLLENNKYGIVTEEDYEQTIDYCYEYIYSPDGSVAGILFLCGLRGNLLYVQANDTVNTAVSLAALLIGIYMVYTLIKTFSGDLRRRRDRAADDIEEKSMDMAGILAFTMNAVYMLDSAIEVYVAKSLCTGVTAAEEALLVSLPVAAVTLGNVLGLPFASRLRRRTGDRRCAMFASAVTTADMVFLALSVRSGSIWLYITGSFIKGFFPGGVICALIQTMPLRAKTDSGRQTVLASVSKGTLSSSIISALAAGYISQYLSYSSVYLLGAAVSVVMGFICLFAFVKKSRDSALNQDDHITASEESGYMAFLLKGPGLVYIIFYILPWSISNGYSKYLFPMYTAGAGVSALLLSNLNVFARTFSFVAIGRVREFSRTLDRSLALTAPLLICCICLVCFILSPNVYWAVAMMFVSELMFRARTEPSWMYIAELAENNNLNAVHAFGDVLGVENMFNAFQAPVLSAIVTFGMNYACATVGAVCGCLCMVFMICERARRNRTIRNQ